MAELMGRKRLVEYLPPFMQKFSELKELMRVCNIETDRIHEQIGKILDEAFIDDCSEHGIKKYESICGILPEDTDTLEERKARVQVKWNDSIPYTYAGLIRKLNTYCGGADKYELVADMEHYHLIIDTHLALSTSVQEVEKMLDRIMPLNMYYKASNTIARELNAVLYGCGATLQTVHCTVQTETNKNKTLETTGYPASAIMTHKLVTIISETKE